MNSSEHSPARLRGRTAWLAVLAILAVSTIPGLTLNRIIVPMLGVSAGGGVLCCYGIVMMIALGFVGARAGSWRYTLVGVLALLPMQILAGMIARMLEGLPLLPLAGDEWKWWTLYLVVHLIPAAAAHKLFTWLQPKSKPGHCLNCNYDLTGNASGRCPECGMPTDALIRR